MGKRYHILFLTFLAVGLLCLGMGCGSDEGEEVIAEVNGYEITQKEFGDYIQSLRYPWTSAQEEYETKRAYLDSLIIQRLMIQEAYEKGIDELSELTRLVMANKDRFLLDALYKKHVTDKVDVTETDVREFYNKLEHRIRASHILVSDPDTAEMLVDRILAGENFGTLAYEYSQDPQAKRNRGDLGYFTWGVMVDEFQEAAFNMEVGEVSPPVKSQLGYHIIKVTGKDKNPDWGNFEAQKEELEARLIQQEQNEITWTYYDSLRNRYPVTIDTATLDYLEHKRTNLYPPQVLATLPSNDFDIEQLDRSERELVLATWDGGQMTLYEYLVQARDRVHPQLRPEFTDYDSIATTVFQLKSQDILVQEAVAEGLENNPEFQRKLRFFKELNMAEIFKMDSLPQPGEPSENAMRMYYDKHPEEFTDPAKVHVFEILVSDEMKANKLAGEINSLEEFKEYAAKHTERPGKRGTYGNLDYIERRWFPDLFDAAWNTPVGEMAGPVPVGRKYSIYWVMDKVQPALKDYIGMKATIKNKLMQRQRQASLEKWVAQAKEEASIEVYEEQLWDMVNTDAYASVDTAATGG
ncbi:hypothetical protein GF420_09340 [candidate division GN15 bacterium]|nr:hypothetical protein [candidate division GN15 bacterium]